MGLARLTLGLALVHRDSSAERERGLEVLAQVRDMCHNGRFYVFMVPVIDVWAARERARCGDRDWCYTSNARRDQTICSMQGQLLVWHSGDRLFGGDAAGSRDRG